MMNSWIDGTLYPDTEVPTELESLSEKVDFLARLCSAWDFGLLPDSETVNEVKKSSWTPAVDACQLLTSPAYHLLRQWHGLPEVPYLGQELALIRDDPCLMWV